MAKSTTTFSCFIFCFSCFTIITPAACSSNETDLLALLAFKAAIHDPLGALNSWNETSHYCSWNGIRCGQRHPDRVVEINMMSQGLVGSISPHIGNLSFLRSITLQNNTFYGQIPQEIGLLKRLEFVEFSNSSFAGPIPRNLSQCTNLVYLNLIDNNLSGIIPPELGSLYKLQALGLSRNKLSGHIPSSIGNLTSLIILSLGSSSLEGEIPQSLAQLQSLTYLVLGDNSLIGSIPLGLFNISSIVYFQVEDNKLQGAIPANIGLTLPNLMVLYLNNNQFSGPVPVSLSNSTSLTKIYMHWNHFTGPMPKDLGRNLGLQSFVIAANHIQDDISFISSMTNCTNLESLILTENLFSGSLPDTIANLSSHHLIELDIAFTQIHGNIPLGIGNLFSLTALSLDYNYLEGPLPLSIGKLSKLGDLRLAANKFTDEIPYTIGNLTVLNYLYMEKNNFSGSIPPSLGSCSNLLTLFLSQNNLSGFIPQELMRLSSISIFLGLSYNSFTGSIPYEIGSLTNLASIDLSNNKLSGVIPNSLSKCISLQWLQLEGNSLHGEIPRGLSFLKGLQYLDLSQNNLSGPIQEFLSNLRLDYLNLSFNRLQGEVPTLGVFGNISAISLDGNEELCGGIPGLKLPPCSSLISSKKGSSTPLKILIPIVVAGGISLTLSVCFIIFIYRQKMTKANLSSFVPSLIGPQFIRFSYEDLLKATGGFSEVNLVGAGKFGSVYKGILEDGKTLIAVKVLNLFVRGATKSFMAECNVLREIRHRNLLKILSICDSIDFQGNEFKALVYEFMANGSLEIFLHPKREEEEEDAEFKSLNMIQRIKIAIDIAQALEYLHFGSDSTIVHGDLKPSNILLDHDMTAHVGDFGLAKIIASTLATHESSSSIAIKGTVGYVPPEYGTSVSVSTHGDVYSYGILLLEMFTNRRPTDDAFEDGINLSNFVSNVLPDRVMEIVDPFIQFGDDMNISKIKDFMASILSIGVACSREIPRNRMSITDVVNELQKIRGSLSG